MAELLPGPLTAPVTWIHPSPGAAAADPGPLGRAMWLLSHKYFSSKKDSQLPSVSGTQLHGRSPLHCRGARPCSVPQPLLQQDRELSCRGPSGVSSLLFAPKYMQRLPKT